MNKSFFLGVRWMFAIMLLSCMSCNAHSNCLSSKVYTHCDSTIYANAVNDSITDIILRAKKICCKLQVRNLQDSTRTDTLKMMPRDLRNVFKYMILDPDNYKSNDIVYGLFSPSICYKICQSRRKYVYVEFDFGLRKWRLLDSKKEVLHTGDMKENNLQFLRFSRAIFPKDKVLRLLHNNLKSL